MNINAFSPGFVKERTLYLTYVLAAGTSLDISSDLPAGGAYLVGIRTNGSGFAIQAYSTSKVTSIDGTNGITSVANLITPIFATHCVVYNTGTSSERINLLWTY